MIKKELKLDEEEVKKAVVHWVNEVIDEEGDTKLEDVDFKLRRDKSSRGGFTSLRFDKAVVKVNNSDE